MANQNKGLGKGWHGNSAGHSKAGRLGGKATAKSRGSEYYSDIGRRGGKSRALRAKFNRSQSQ